MLRCGEVVNRELEGMDFRAIVLGQSKSSPSDESPTKGAQLLTSYDVVYVDDDNIEECIDSAELRTVPIDEVRADPLTANDEKVDAIVRR